MNNDSMPGIKSTPREAVWFVTRIFILGIIAWTIIGFAAYGFVRFIWG